MTEFATHFVGTGGTTPSIHRGLPATLIRFDGKEFLVDAGEGTQRALMQQGLGGHFDAVLLTHQHADHWLGLPGLLKTWGLQDRTSDLVIVGPHRALVNVRGAMEILGDTLPFKLVYHDLFDPVDGEIFAYKDLTVSAYPTDHGVPSFGFVFAESQQPGRFDVKEARKLGVTDGRDYGKLTAGESVHTDGDPGMVVTPAMVVGPPRKGRKVVVTGDTRPTHTTVEAARDADLLVHDAAFLGEDFARAKRTKHSTVHEAAYTASEANAGTLALVHTGARYTRSAVLSEAANSARVVLPNDGDRIEIRRHG